MDKAAPEPFVCPICGNQVTLTSALAVLGLRPTDVSPSHPDHVRKAMNDMFVAPHWVSRWSTQYKFMCPMSNAKARPV